MDSRPEGLAFFRPLITLLNRQISSDILLFLTMIINPEYPPANAQVIFNRALEINMKIFKSLFMIHFHNKILQSPFYADNNFRTGGKITGYGK